MCVPDKNCTFITKLQLFRRLRNITLQNADQAFIRNVTKNDFIRRVKAVNRSRKQWNKSDKTVHYRLRRCSQIFHKPRSKFHRKSTLHSDGKRALSKFIYLLKVAACRNVKIQ